MANATGRPIAPLILSSDEQAYLERQVRRHRVARSLSERCRIILRCADGVPSKSVASELGVHEHTVGKWRRRFLTDRIDGLLDEARLRAGSYEAMLNCGGSRPTNLAPISRLIRQITLYLSWTISSPERSRTNSSGTSNPTT
jgi:hypothetical protein